MPADKLSVLPQRNCSIFFTDAGKKDSSRHLFVGIKNNVEYCGHLELTAKGKD